MRDDPAPKSPIRHLVSDAVLPPSLPFSDGVRVGPLVFLSGMIGTKPGTLELVPGGIEAEARQTLENLRLVLARHGLALTDLARVQVMLADIADWPAFNRVYADIIRPPWPARSAFAASGLALNARCEVEAVAVVRD
jgi:reactive intermediate/imine deaminase